MNKIFQKILTYICLVSMLLNSFPMVAYASDLSKEKELDVFELPKEEIKMEPIIVNEMEEKRGESEKHFKMSDGSMMAAMYADEIHYLKNGKHLEIDNNLIENNGRYYQKNSKNEISFSKESNISNTLEYKNKSKVLKMGLKNSDNVLGHIKEEKNTKVSIFDFTLKNYNENKIEINKGKNEIKYKEIQSGIDLVYEVEGDQAKESIVINSKKSLKLTFEYNLDIDELSIVQENDNSIVLLDSKTKEEIFYINAPYMYDANQSYSDGLKLTIEGKILKLQLLDKEWLNSKDRVYPIIVDPSVTSNRHYANIDDTYIYEGDSNNTTKHNAHIIRIGNTSLVDIYNNPARGLIKFSLPTLSSGDQVVGAGFYLTSYSQYYSSGNNRQLNLHKITQSWNGSSARWSNMSDANTYDSRKTDYIMFQTNLNGGVMYGFDVTSIAQEWYTKNNNYGVMIKENSEQKNYNSSDMHFISSDTSSAYANYRPHLTVTYFNQDGLQESSSYHNQTIGRTMVYTNDFNGNLILTHLDASTPGNRFPVSVEHVYNTSSANANTMSGNIYGRGFKLNVAQRLSVVGNKATYRDDTSAVYWFNQSDSDYYDEENLGLIITASGSDYIIKDKEGNRSKFSKIGNSANWHLKEIKDTNGNTITINLDATNPDKILSVEDAVGDTLTFNYTNNLLTSIMDTANRTISYGYTGNNLTSITYPDGKVTQYTYTTSNCIKDVINIDGSKISYEYYSGYNLARVSKITEYGTDGINLGNRLNITYGQNVTTFIDNKEFINNMTFNNYGQVISVSDFSGDIIDEEVYGSTATYGTVGNNKNKLIANTNLTKATSNYLLNHNFETTGNWTFAGNCNYSTEEFYHGNRSLKCASASSTTVSAKQSIEIEKGNSYTFSAYVKSSITGPILPKLKLTYIDYNGNEKDKETQIINTNGDFERHSITILYPSDASSQLTISLELNNVSGSVYFDSVQLETGKMVNNYNFIQNGNFFHNDLNWEKGSNNSNDGIQKINGNKVYSFYGEASLNKYINQTIDVKGKAGDSFSLSFWYKNLGIPNYNASGKYTMVRLNIIGTDGSSNWQDSTSLNPDKNAWQMENYIFKMPKDYKQIIVHFCFYKQANRFYVDNVTLEKDVSENSYQYDKNGNLIEAQDQTKNADILINNPNNQLISNFSARGFDFTYEYSYSIKNRLTKAINKNTNLEYNLDYDQYGNNTGLTVKPDSTEELEDGVYFINSKETGRAIDSQGGTPANNKKFHQNQYSMNINQRMRLTKANDYYYKIATENDPSKVFTIDNDDYLVMYNYSEADNQLWKLIKHPDNTYEIISKTNGKAITIKDDNVENGAFYIITNRDNRLGQRFNFYQQSKVNKNVLLDSGVYRMKNKKSNLYLDYKAVSGSSYVYQNTLNETSYSQLWRVENRGEYYKIYSSNSIGGYSLGTLGNTDTLNTQIIASAENSNTGQNFRITKELDGTYRIITAFASGRNLAIANASTAVGEYVKLKDGAITDDFKFYFEKVGLNSLEDGIYTISKNGLNIGTQNDSYVLNTRVQLQNPANTDTQKWRLTKLKNGYYTISLASATNDTTFDIYNGGTGNGTQLVIYTKTSNPSASKQFEIVPLTNGLYAIKPRHTTGTSCINLPGSTITSGTFLQLYKCQNNDMERFAFIKIDEPESIIKTSSEYSPNGNYLTKSKDQRGNDTTYNYNINTGTTTSIINPKNITTSYTYDTLNRITSVSNGNTTNSYTYNNDKLSTISHNGFNYNFNYDIYGNVSAIKVGNQTLITNNYEPNNGNLLSSTYGNNNTISYSYDYLNRISKKTKQDKIIEYTYNNQNHLSMKKDNDNTYKYEYDLAGRLVKTNQNNKYSSIYKYDSTSSINDVTYKLDTTTNTSKYIYDKDSKQLTYSVNDTLTAYDYDSFGRLTKKEINTPTKYETTYAYLTINNRTTTLLEKIKNKTNELKYEYDNLGNITKIYKNNTIQNEYTYDNKNQLSIEKNHIRNELIQYSYDSGGNILSKTTKDLGTNAIINTDTYGYQNIWKDQLTSYNNSQITYDNIGNPLTIGDNISMSWINGRELHTYEDTSKNLEVLYKYNDEGIRTEKTVNDVRHEYYLEGTKIIYETFNNNTIYYFYDSNGSIEGFKYNNDIYYYIKNGQNDIIGIVNEAGNEIASYEYDAWGRVLSVKDNQGNEIVDSTNVALINPFRYRSYYYDSEIELYYLNSRYYIPEMGRFINADGIIGANKDILGYNLYAYVSNNPVNCSDSSGEAVGVATLGGLIGSGLGVIGLGPLAGAVAVGGALIYSMVKIASKVDTVTKSKTIIPQPKKEENKKTVIFPANPYNFNPQGLTPVINSGTGNGMVITWINEYKQPIFRWDQDFRYGSHYHIVPITMEWDGKRKDAPHFIVGQKVPEPFATIYFKGK